MNIVDAILDKNKKYIILISGYLWWDNFNSIIKALATNLNFEVIYINQLIQENKLITSSDQINFPVINEIVKEKLNNNKETKIYKGYIIVSYSFPPERLDFFPDIHVSIQANPVLLTSLIIDLIKTKNVSRMDVDIHLAYLSKTWKTNKITKTIFLQPDYEPNINKYYGFIFDAIIENITKKLFGEKAEEILAQNNSQVNVSKYPLPPTNQTLTTISDDTKLTTHTLNVINEGVKISELNTDLDDIVLNNKNDDDDSNNEDDDTTNTKNIDNDNNDNDNNEIALTLTKKNTPYYIGKRSLNIKKY